MSLPIALTTLAEGGFGDMLVPLVLIGFIMYFVVIRPGNRERKQREAQLAGIKKHDKVITNAGIHGTVVALEDDVVVLRVDDKNNVRMRFNRASIWQVVAASGEREGKAEEKAVEETAS